MVVGLSVLVRSLYRVVEASLNVSFVCLLWCRELSSEVGFLMPHSATVVVVFLEVLVQLRPRVGLLLGLVLVSKYLMVVVVMVVSLLVVVVVLVASFVLVQRVGRQPSLVLVLSLLRVGVLSLMVLLLLSCL